MEKVDEIISRDTSVVSIINNCNEAHILIIAGMENIARSKFPLEFYLLKKYMEQNFEDFKSKLKMRIGFENQFEF